MCFGVMGRSLWGLLRVAAEVSCSSDCQWQLTRAPRAFDMVSEAAGSLRGLLRASSSADAATNGACCPSTMEMWRLILVLKKRMLWIMHMRREHNPSAWNGCYTWPRFVADITVHKPHPCPKRLFSLQLFVRAPIPCFLLQPVQTPFTIITY